MCSVQRAESSAHSEEGLRLSIVDGSGNGSSNGQRTTPPHGHVPRPNCAMQLVGEEAGPVRHSRCTQTQTSSTVETRPRPKSRVSIRVPSLDEAITATASPN